MKNEDEVQPPPLVCPQCDQEFDFVEGQWEYTCLNCGNHIENIQAQFAYSRGYDAFYAGQRVYMEIPPNRGSHLAFAEQTHEATQLFTEAYTAIQEAFQANLADSQRYKAIEIMAWIANLFMHTNLISHLEADYWTSLRFEQVNRKEYDELNLKLAQPTSGAMDLLTKLNWRRRKHNLEKGLYRVSKRINLIEQNIAFTTPPRVRKGTSGSTESYHV
jgi:predicted RNA-binding Zn-ribbon protein involved in translation (DUF1610 family)